MWMASAGAQQYVLLFPTDTVILVNGNRIKMGGGVDSFLVKDPITGQESLHLDYSGYRSRLHKDTIILNRIPLELNGKEIYSPYGKAELRYCAELVEGDAYLTDYINKTIRKQAGKLSRAAYGANLANILVDEAGKVVYYEYLGFHKSDGFNKTKLKEAFLHKADDRVRTALTTVRLKQAKADDKIVPYRIKEYELP